MLLAASVLAVALAGVELLELEPLVLEALALVPVFAELARFALAPVPTLGRAAGGAGFALTPWA